MSNSSAAPAVTVHFELNANSNEKTKIVRESQKKYES